MFTLLFLVLFIIGCTPTAKEEASNNQKIGVLLVNHGSRSSTWRQVLMDLEKNVQSRILSGGVVKGTKTAHMEYTEPSIATQLKAF
ncbi:MAG TPA: hypothetical protein PKM03_12465, partial [Cyclobacteriaceae bacterium]|nr:hypothetical protein [Cyclobacteriaceae bacterium]